MAYNFKSIADVEVVAEPAESANVLVEEDGVIKKVPKTAVGGGGGSDLDFSIIVHKDGTAKLISGTYQDIYNKLINEDLIRGTAIHYYDNDGFYIYSHAYTEFTYSIQEGFEDYLLITSINSSWHNYLLYPNNRIEYQYWE